MASEREERSAEHFRQGFSCSQSVLAACGGDFGLEPEVALRVAGAFGGGLARTGGPCGALSGALMVVGLKYGKVRVDDLTAKDRTYAVAREFVDGFVAQHGSMLCRELLGYDLSIPEQRQAAHDLGLLTSLCPLLVRSAVCRLEEMGIVGQGGRTDSTA
jgi:C_GCAxxG_C_C family probable redox protein